MKSEIPVSKNHCEFQEFPSLLLKDRKLSKHRDNTNRKSDSGTVEKFLWGSKMTVVMKRLAARLRNWSNLTTPRFVGVLIVLAVLLDSLLIFVLAKKTLFPLSLTWGEYALWISDIVSIWTGRIAWVLLIVLSGVLPLLRGKRVQIPELSAFGQNLLKKAFGTLDRLVVAATVLGVSVFAFAFLGFKLVRASHPAPPPAGRLVLPADPSSPLLYRAFDQAIAIYNRKQGSASGGLVPFQVFQLKDAGRIERIAVSYDQKRIFATDSQHGVVHVINTESKDAFQEKRLTVGTTASALAFSGDGRKLYVGVTGPVPQGTVHVFDMATLKEIGTVTGLGCPVDLYAAATEPLLFVATQCGAGNDPLYVVDTRKDKVIKKLPGFAVGQSVVATPDGRTVFVSTGDSLSIVKDYMLEKPYVRRVQIPVATMAVTVDGRLLLIGTKNGIVSVDVNQEKLCFGVGLEADPQAIGIAPDGGVFGLLETRIFLSDYRALECK